MGQHGVAKRLYVQIVEKYTDTAAARKAREKVQ